MSIPSDSPFDVLHRIRELTAADPWAGHVTRQHVISEVLLRRFAAPAGSRKGLICYFNLMHPPKKLKLLGPDGCGKVPNFVQFASKSAEDLWKETEDKLHDVFLDLDAGTFFEKESNVRAIKNAIALHFARSKAARVIHFRTWTKVVVAGRRRWLRDPQAKAALAAEFYKTKGLYPAGDQALSMFFDEKLELSRHLAESGALFRTTVERFYYQARKKVESTGLEILTPKAGEFLIGDVPALTLRHDRNEVGVLGGIAMNDAHTVTLPLGPHHMAALGKSNIWQQLAKEQVEIANAQQIKGAIEYVYMRPDSGLDSYVRSFIQD